MFIQQHNHGGGDSGPREAHPEGEIYDPAGFKQIEAAGRKHTLLYTVLFIAFLVGMLVGLGNNSFGAALVICFPVFILMFGIRMEYDAKLRTHEKTVAIEKARQARQLAEGLSAASAQIAATSTWYQGILKERTWSTT